MNVYETYVYSVYVLLTWEYKSIKTCAIEQILMNNSMLKINNKYNKTRCEISPSSTIKRTSLT